MSQCENARRKPGLLNRTWEMCPACSKPVRQFVCRQKGELAPGGGMVREGIIKVQGDHREILIRDLQKPGWKVKRTGG